MKFQRMDVNIPYFHLKAKLYEFIAIVVSQIVTLCVCVCVCVCVRACVRACVLYALTLENMYI